MGVPTSRFLECVHIAPSQQCWVYSSPPIPAPRLELRSSSKLPSLVYKLITLNLEYRNDPTMILQLRHFLGKSDQISQYVPSWPGSPNDGKPWSTHRRLLKESTSLFRFLLSCFFMHTHAACLCGVIEGWRCPWGGWIYFRHVAQIGG